MHGCLRSELGILNLVPSLWVLGLHPVHLTREHTIGSDLMSSEKVLLPCII